VTLSRYDIHDHVEQLTRTHTNRQTFVRFGETVTRKHLTMVPPLLVQLEMSDVASKGDVGSGSGYGSRPAASIEAIETLMLIDDEACRLLYKLGVDDPNQKIDRRTHLPVDSQRGCNVIAVTRVVNRVHGLYPSQDSATRADIERAVARWWSQARITSGWDSPAWRPDNTCPVCEQRRSLRIKLADQMGFCVECRSMWDPSEIGLLADWIRLENAEDETEEAS
jgi:hypothetical protein